MFYHDRVYFCADNENRKRMYARKKVLSTTEAERTFRSLKDTSQTPDGLWNRRATRYELPVRQRYERYINENCAIKHEMSEAEKSYSIFLHHRSCGRLALRRRNVMKKLYVK